MSQGERRLAAIMFTDVVGYTALTQENESTTLRLLEDNRKLIRPIFASHGGREIKTIGDAFLIEFPSALDAVLCSVAVQQMMHDRKIARGETLSLRVGIHVGDVIEKGDDILGDAVNIASRIEPLAEPGGVCISSQVYDQVKNKSSLPFVSLGPKSLKNISESTEVYAMKMPWTNERVEHHPEILDSERIAVLPFVSLSPDPNDEYFADGLTEELIDKLCQLKELEVIARTSVMNYKKKEKSVSDIGRELKVGTLVEGSVRKAGNRIRVTVQLVNSRTEGHIWSSTYDREMDDVFAVQSDIAQRVADAMKVSLHEEDRLSIAKRPTKSIEAYKSYLRGLQQIQSSGLQAQDVIECFENAIRLDPTFSSAYAALGNYYVMLAGETMPTKEGFRKARPLIAKALELDDSSCDAHVAMGNLALQSRQDFESAEAEFKRAIELNPSSATAHLWRGQLLRLGGDFAGALKETRRAHELDPLGLASSWLPFIQMISHDFDGAVSFVLSEVEAEPNKALHHSMLALLYLLMGRRDQALSEADLSMKLGPHEYAKFNLAYVLASLGRRDEARELMKEVDSKRLINKVELATVYLALGERDRAFDLMEQDFDEDLNGFLFYHQDVRFDPFREDPRFVALMQKLNLSRMNSVKS